MTGPHEGILVATAVFGAVGAIVLYPGGWASRDVRSLPVLRTLWPLPLTQDQLGDPQGANLTIHVSARDFTVGSVPTFIATVNNLGAESVDGVEITIVAEYSAQVVRLPTPRRRNVPMGGSVEVLTKGAFTITDEVLEWLRSGKQVLRVSGDVIHGTWTRHYCEQYSRFSDDTPLFVPCGDAETGMMDRP